MGIQQAITLLERKLRSSKHKGSKQKIKELIEKLRKQLVHKRTRKPPTSVVHGDPKPYKRTWARDD